MIKKIGRWLILGGTLFLIAKALKDNWSEVATVKIDPTGWGILAIATGVTLLAHTWAGWVWTWILRSLNQSINTSEFVAVYLETNIYKYLPGNFGHHYSRVVAAQKANIPMGIATLSVLLEPLLMAAAALIVFILLGHRLTLVETNLVVRLLQIFAPIAILIGIHPFFLNRLLKFASKLKNKKNSSPSPSAQTNNSPSHIKKYPLQPLVGEFGFLLLRGSGFIFTVFAIAPLQIEQIPLLLGTFSWSWLLGFIIPGAPGGIGVFEATAIFLLQHHYPTALVLASVGLYRVISIIAEGMGAGLAYLDRRLFAPHEV